MGIELNEKQLALLNLRGLIAQAAPHMPPDWEFDGISIVGELARAMSPTEDILGPVLLAWVRNKELTGK